MNIIDFNFLVAALRLATPITIIAIGETYSERSGIINVGVEGMAILGALVSAVVSFYTGNPWIGLSASVVASAISGWLHALWCIRFSANQIVSGIAINILVMGLAYFSTSMIWGWRGTSGSAATLNIWIIVGLMFGAILISQIFIYRTRWGLRLRVVGERPEAADTAGINVARTRYTYTILNGAFCGLAGAFFFNNLGRFTAGMVGGRGFIGIAAMVVGNYIPVRVLGAAFLFGFIDALQMRLQAFIPSQFSIMLPYLLTVIILAGFMGKADIPKALGKS
ncbi:TPA: ABC transporter permease [Candidatus Poribacteria bacterium]|nr:ABC transporter permease [Candidatus Poribacteria bacterium]